MKKCIEVTALFFAVLVVMSSCKKDKTEPAPLSPTMYIPSSDVALAGSLLHGDGTAEELSSPLSDVWGILLSSGLEVKLTDTTDQLNSGYESWQEAFFCGTDGTGLINAKQVSINNKPIASVGDHYYSQNVWRDNWLNHWEVDRNNDIPEVSANIMGVLPYFAGTLPAQVSRSAGLSLALSSKNVYGADSAYVLLHSNGTVVKSNVVGVQTTAGGTARITSDQLSKMQNEYISFNNKACYGVLAVVVVYKDTTETFEGKRFAFVTQRELAQNITLK